MTKSELDLFVNLEAVVAIKAEFQAFQGDEILLTLWRKQERITRLFFRLIYQIQEFQFYRAEVVI